MIYHIPEEATQHAIHVEFYRDIPINYVMEKNLASAKMLLNIFRQSALTSWMEGDIENVKQHSAWIKIQETSVEALTESYTAFRTAQYAPKQCACGAFHSPENPVTYDVLFKAYICEDCQIAHELDE